MRAPCKYMSPLTRELWDGFSVRFKSDNSPNVYFGDINQCMEVVEKDLLEFHQGDADKYYDYLLKEVQKKNLKSTTMKKKIKELHKFSEYIMEQTESLIPDDFNNYFYIYAIQYFKDEDLQDLPQLNELDKLMEVAKDNIMHYAILAIAHRMGLRSTQVCNQKISDIVVDPNGAYFILDKNDVRYVPDDVWTILNIYLETYRINSDSEYLFYNTRGAKLNTQYICAMMKNLCKKAGIRSMSYADIRNTCGAVLFAYDARPDQVAKQLGIGMAHVKRYDNIVYRNNVHRKIAQLVQLKVKPPIQKDT